MVRFSFTQRINLFTSPGPNSPLSVLVQDPSKLSTRLNSLSFHFIYFVISTFCSLFIFPIILSITHSVHISFELCFLLNPSNSQLIAHSSIYVQFLFLISIQCSLFYISLNSAIYIYLNYLFYISLNYAFYILLISAFYIS